MRKGDIGAQVTNLQRQLKAAGFNIEVDGWFGDQTEQAVIALQKRAGLIADGLAGPKTIAALISRDKNPLLLSEADLQRAADRLGVELAAIKAVNTVESRGRGFLDDGRPVILYERHVAWRLLIDSGTEETEADRLADRYPNLINKKRGGYAGGTAEWSRLASALQILPPEVAYGACSWGQFQIMGEHAATLGYASIDEFVTAMRTSEAAQLDAFCRFLEAEPALLKALKARKWAAFAAGYNGPAYRENAYDARLAAAYARYLPPAETAIEAAA